MDEELAARLRASCDARIAEAVAAGQRLVAANQESRAAFAEARAVGLRVRHALKTAYLKEN